MDVAQLLLRDLEHKESKDYNTLKEDGETKQIKMLKIMQKLKVKEQSGANEIKEILHKDGILLLKVVTEVELDNLVVSVLIIVDDVAHVRTVWKKNCLMNPS